MTVRVRKEKRPFLHSGHPSRRAPAGGQVTVTQAARLVPFRVWASVECRAVAGDCDSGDWSAGNS